MCCKHQVNSVTLRLKSSAIVTLSARDRMIEKKNNIVVPNHLHQYLDDTLVTPWQATKGWLPKQRP